MIVGRGLQTKLEEDAPDVGLDRAVGQEQLLRDRPIRSTLRHQREDLALACRELVQWILMPSPADQEGDHAGIDDELPRRDPADAADEVIEILDAILEHVARAARPILDEADRVVHLHVLGEHEHPDARDGMP